MVTIWSLYMVTMIGGERFTDGNAKNRQCGRVVSIDQGIDLCRTVTRKEPTRMATAVESTQLGDSPATFSKYRRHACVRRCVYTINA